MSRIRGKDTTIELILRSALHQAGFVSGRMSKVSSVRRISCSTRLGCLFSLMATFGTDIGFRNGGCRCPISGNKRFIGTECVIDVTTQGSDVRDGLSLGFGSIKSSVILMQWFCGSQA